MLAGLSRCDRHLGMHMCGGTNEHRFDGVIMHQFPPVAGIVGTVQRLAYLIGLSLSRRRQRRQFTIVRSPHRFAKQ